MLSVAHRATLTPLSCSPIFLRAQYLYIRTLTHELREQSLTIGGGKAGKFWGRASHLLNGFCATEILSTA